MKTTFLYITLFAFFCAFEASGQHKSHQQLQVQLEKAHQAEIEYLREQQQVDSLVQNFNLDRQFVSDGRFFEMMKVENGQPVYYTTHNIDAQATIAVDKVHPGGSTGLNLTGEGITLGEWDVNGVRVSHQEFEGRVTQNDDASELSGHATHVAGTMIAAGVNADAEGMSPQARLLAHDWSNDMSEMREEGAKGLLVSNHSYGKVMGWGGQRACKDDSDEEFPAWHGNTSISLVEDYRFGFYTNDDQRWDDIAYDNPNYLMVQSAGNDRGESGPPDSDPGHCVYRLGEWVYSERDRQADGGENGFESTGSTAKNILTVGAVRDIAAGYQQPSDVYITGFSSFGPTDDGRIKPDVVGNGVGLLSTCSAGDNCYSRSSGTSMSSPSVAGAIGLLHEYYNRLHGSGDQFLQSSAIKALLIQTADEAGRSPGPDYKHGWGLVNIKRASELIKLDSIHGGEVIQELTLNESDTIRVPLEVSPGEEELNVTVGWTDPPGDSPNPQLDPSTKMLVNNVDLKIIGPDTVHYPWKLDKDNPAAAAEKGKNNVDNIEQVTVSDPPSGDYVVQITHDGSLQNQAQDISLILDRGPGETYDASGKITINHTGEGAANVPLQISGFGSKETVQTDSLGNFQFGGLYNKGTYKVQPDVEAVEGVDFSPDSIQFTVEQQNITGLEFSASTPGKRKVTLKLNTATLPDTIRASDTLQVRGNVGGTSTAPDRLPDGNTLAWDDQSTLSMENIGGDYWKVDFEIPEMESVNFKYYSAQNSEIQAGGLETGKAHVIEKGIGHINLPLHYFEQSSDTDYSYDWLPWDSREDKIAVMFRIYLPARYSPIIVGVRGDGLNRRGPLRIDQTRLQVDREVQSDTEPGYRLFSGVAYYDTTLTGLTQEYKYNFELIDWMEAPWRSFTIPDHDTTLHWSYPNNVLPVVPDKAITISSDSVGLVNVLEGAYDPDGDSLFIDKIQNPTQGRAEVVSDSLVKYTPDTSYTGKVQLGYTIKDEDGAKVDAELKIEVEKATGISDEIARPEEFSLGQNYPNPFNPSTTIQYSLPKSVHVSLIVYNSIGRRVATLVDRNQSAGNYSVHWDARSMNSGVYLYRIKAGKYHDVGNMILIK